MNSTKVRVRQRQIPTKQSSILSWAGLPRLWEPLGWVLPRDVRERQFTPAFEDIRQDYLLDLRQLRLDEQVFRMSPRRVALIKFCMNVRTVFWTAKLLSECILGAFRKTG